MHTEEKDNDGALNTQRDFNYKLLQKCFSITIWYIYIYTQIHILIQISLAAWNHFLLSLRKSIFLKWFIRWTIKYYLLDIDNKTHLLRQFFKCMQKAIFKIGQPKIKS